MRNGSRSLARVACEMNADYPNVFTHVNDYNIITCLMINAGALLCEREREAEHEMRNGSRSLARVACEINADYPPRFCTRK